MAQEGEGPGAGPKQRVQSVLFVCAHNIVRSPMAEALARHYFGKSVYVQSAGVRKREADPFMMAALDEMGIKARSGRDGKSGDEPGGDPASAAQIAGAAATAPSWSRPEGPARVEAASRALPTELEGLEKMHRLLIGQKGPR